MPISIFDQIHMEREMNDPDRFLKKAKALVMEQRPDDAQIYIVWFSKTLQHWKALLSTDGPDTLYYEVTYDGDKKLAYVDTYEKTNQTIVHDKY